MFTLCFMQLLGNLAMFMVLGGCVKVLINLLFSCCLFLALASI